jgi:diketogulonate reductase-like aldo/keto reductase
MWSRRQVIKTACTTVAGALAARNGLATESPIRRRIPASGEELPVIGMGTSRTFDAGDDSTRRARLAQVLQDFFAGGGMLVDSSPMYGSAEAVTGDLLRQLKPATVFTATKVWTDGREAGMAQMSESARRLGVGRIDLMQIHNLRDWRVHLATLRDWQQAGKIRYLGITTSTARQYEEFGAVMRAEKLDFIQLNYSIGEPEAAEKLLPLARDRGMATLINRPFMRSELFKRVDGKPLPGWAREIGCASWGQVFLKWIIAHPAVTCVIPATANPANMRDNMQAGFGALPDEALRGRIATAVGLG